MRRHITVLIILVVALIILVIAFVTCNKAKRKYKSQAQQKYGINMQDFQYLAAIIKPKPCVNFYLL